MNKAKEFLDSKYMKLLWCLPDGELVEVPDDIKEQAKKENNGVLFLDRRTKSYKVIEKWAKSIDPDKVKLAELY
jgi:hypothetical protein